MEQVWFRGTHGDIGGHLNGFEAARPLSNIPLVWMGQKIEQCGVVLPENWIEQFSQDASAPSVGNWRGWAKMFLTRRKRTFGNCKSERIYEV